jgi:hypothetical protein
VRNKDETSVGFDAAIGTLKAFSLIAEDKKSDKNCASHSMQIRQPFLKIEHQTRLRA